MRLLVWCWWCWWCACVGGWPVRGPACPHPRPPPLLLLIRSDAQPAPPPPALVPSTAPDGDLDTVVLEPPSDSSAPLLMVRTGGGRGVIGAIIGGVPWLPLELNVPDAVRWLLALLAGGGGGGGGVRYRASEYAYGP